MTNKKASSAAIKNKLFQFQNKLEISKTLAVPQLLPNAWLGFYFVFLFEEEYNKIL